MPSSRCTNCGAPPKPGQVTCEFCGQPYDQEVAASALKCPNPTCGTFNVRGAPKCVKCSAWLIVQCVFCGQASPYTDTACSSCREPFQGSAQRKAARDQQGKHEQTLDMLGRVSNVASPLLGAVAGAAVGSWMFGSNHGHHGGYGHPGHGPQGYGRPGYPDPRYGNPGYPNPGYPQAGYPNPGHPNPGYPNPGYPNPGYPNPGYPDPAYSHQPYPQGPMEAGPYDPYGPSYRNPGYEPGFQSGDEPALLESSDEGESLVQESGGSDFWSSDDGGGDSDE